MSDDPKPHEYPLVLVEWHDAYGCSPDWEDLTDIDARPITCRSVGWMVQDRDDCIVIVPHRAGSEGFAKLDGDGESAGKGCGDMTIPRRAVTRITNLDEQACGRAGEMNMKGQPMTSTQQLRQLTINTGDMECRIEVPENHIWTGEDGVERVFVYHVAPGSYIPEERMAGHCTFTTCRIEGESLVAEENMADHDICLAPMSRTEDMEKLLGVGPQWFNGPWAGMTVTGRNGETLKLVELEA